MNYHDLVSSKRLQRCVFLILTCLKEITQDHMQTFGSDLLKDYILTSSINVNKAKQIHVELILQYVGAENFQSIHIKSVFDAHEILHEKNNVVIHLTLSEAYHKMIENAAHSIEKYATV